MALFSIDILGLTKGTPKASDEYVAVDVTDVTMSTIGTDKKYLLADIYLFMVAGLGFPTLPAVEAASTGPYVATYNNGIGGINATLTDASGTFAPFTIDGIPGVKSSLTTPHAYLIKNQLNPAENGIYFLTINGDGISQPWVLERAFYFNSPSNIIDGSVTMVTSGVTQTNTAWQLSAPGVIVVGTTNLIWNAFALLSTFITLPLLPQFGGTGIANPNTSTLTIAGPITTIGNFPVIFNFTGATNVTFPTSGTLATVSQLPVLPLTVPNGGTGNTTFTPFSVICAGTTATGVFQNVSGVGIANQVLTSNGPGSLPTWQSVPGLVPAALTRVDDTNVTITLGGTPATALLQAVSLTMGWSGQLSTPRGGTGVNSPTIHNLLIGNGASPLTLLPPSATAGIPLISQGVLADPAYGTAVVSGGGTGNTTFTAYSVICAGTTATGAFQNVSGVGVAGQVLTSNGAASLPTWQAPTASGTVNPGLINEIGYYAASGSAISPISPTQINGLLVTSNTGVPSILAGPGTANHVLMSNAAAAPSWSVPTYPNASVTAGKIIISDGTNYVASTPTYPNASVTAGKIIISDGTNYLASTSIWPNTVGTAGKIVISDGTSNVYSTPTYPNASATLNHFIISDGTNFIASSSALNLAGNLTTVGAFSSTFTMTNTTSVTFPTSGTLATTSQIINWNNVTSTPISLVDNNGYVVNNGAAQVIFNLPATSPIGQRFLIVGHDTGGWKVAQSNVNQHIHFGNATSTVGLAGFIESTDGNDCVELICTATDNEFTVRNAVGNINVA